MVTKNLFSFAAMTAKTLCLVAAAAMALTLASCGDDDDGGGSAEGSQSAGHIETLDGTTLLLTSVADIGFGYDAGKLVMMDGDYCDYTVSYNPFTISLNDDNETQVFSNISVNGSGYITSMNVTLTSDYEGSYYSDSSSGSGSFKFSYDGNGRLTQITFSGSGSGKEVEYDDSYSYSSSVSASATLSWSGSLLQDISCSYNASGKEYGYNWKEVETATIAYENSTSYPNATYQYTPNTTTIWGGLVFDEDIMEALAYLGYFGKGPSYHPVSADIEEYLLESYDNEYEDYEDDYSYTSSYSYSLNSDGSVNYSKMSGSSKSNFTYSLYGVSDEDVSVKSRVSLKEMPEGEEEAPARQRRGIFGRRLHKSHKTAE